MTTHRRSMAQGPRILLVNSCHFSVRAIGDFRCVDCHTVAMHDLAEHTLLALGKQGDAAAISELFTRHYGTSLNIARRILSSEPESEDAVQSAYCSAFQHLHEFRGDAGFKSWLHRIVVNRCLVMFRDPWHRRRQRLESLSNSDDPDSCVTLDIFPSSTLSPEQSALHGEILSAFNKAVHELPECFQAPYAMYAEGRSIAEIARRLGLSIAATKSRVFRARSNIRLSLGSLGLNDGNKGPRDRTRQDSVQ